VTLRHNAIRSRHAGITRGRHQQTFASGPPWSSIDLQATANSFRSCVALALGRGSPRAFGIFFKLVGGLTMSLQTQGLSRDLLEQVLSRLGLSDRPALTLDGLQTLYAAWCRKVPFDNVRKLIHLHDHTPRARSPAMTPQSSSQPGSPTGQEGPAGPAMGHCTPS